MCNIAAEAQCVSPLHCGILPFQRDVFAFYCLLYIVVVVVVSSAFEFRVLSHATLARLIILR